MQLKLDRFLEASKPKPELAPQPQQVDIVSNVQDSFDELIRMDGGESKANHDSFILHSLKNLYEHLEQWSTQRLVDRLNEGEHALNVAKMDIRVTTVLNKEVVGYILYTRFGYTPRETDDGIVWDTQPPPDPRS